MHNLVVCGATNHESNADGAMFVDFMGICLLLQHLQPEFTGAFLSCFPLEKHFDFLGSKSPPITDIRWTRIVLNAIYKESQEIMHSRPLNTKAAKDLSSISSQPHRIWPVTTTLNQSCSEPWWKHSQRELKGSPFLVYTREEFERSPSRRWY